MDKRIREIILREGLTSVMNATKWRELAVALGAMRRDGPTVRLKYVYEELPNPGFSHLDWEWVKDGSPEVIEWMEIDPVFRTHRGQLIADHEEDLSDAVVAALKAHGIPFSREGSILKVWGYVRSGAQPEFVG